MVSPSASNQAKQTHNTQRAGPGIFEGSLHPSTGLRNHGQHIIGANDDFCIVGDADSTAGTAFSDKAVWTALPLSGGGLTKTMPYPCTPVVGILEAVASATWLQVIKIKMTGYNQFNDPIVEVSPQITVPVPSNSGSVVADHVSYFYMSKVFSKVVKVEYMASDTTTDNLIMVGVRPVYNMDKTADLPAGETLTKRVIGNSHYNFGFGTPIRCRPYRISVAGTVVSIVQDQGKQDIMNMTMKDASGALAAVAPSHEFDRVSGVNSLMSGWLIGQSDPALAWQGDPNKWKIFSVSVSSNLHVRLLGNDPSPDTEPDWDFGDVVEFTVAFGTSLRTSKGFEVATYGDTPVFTYES